MATYLSILFQASSPPRSPEPHGGISRTPSMMTGVATTESMRRANGTGRTMVRSRSLNDLAEVYTDYSISSTLFSKEKQATSFEEVLKRDPFHQHVGTSNCHETMTLNALKPNIPLLCLPETQ